MENWQANKTNHLIAAVLIALLTSCGGSGGKSGDGGKNPEPTPVDTVPNPEQEPSAPTEPLIKDEKTVAHIETQFANDGEKHAAAVLAADTLELAAAKTPEDVQNIAHHQLWVTLPLN